MQKIRLPKPSREAQRSSHELAALIQNDIQTHGGWISFARYMALALYTPHLGYYAGGSAKLGSAGDFITAPELSSLFGATLAHFAHTALLSLPRQIMEFGAGTGKLAADILTELRDQGFGLDRYYIVEVSGELRARQEQRLKDFPEVVWLEQMPESFSGLVLGNEVLDAMPVTLVKKTTSAWSEVGVTFKNGAFQWAERPLNDKALLTQIPNLDQLPIGYLSECHPLAKAFMTSVADMLCKGQGGVAAFIDYGFPAEEYYLPQRDQGTLMCHYRHHAHTDPFFWPGLQDITSHIDFSVINDAAQSAGLTLLSYETQAAFLLRMGIGELLMRTSPEDALRYLPQASAVQKLVSPAEMGELFKVIVFSKPAQYHVQSR